jgi:endonuclease YncB( thermonuclease family)
VYLATPTSEADEARIVGAANAIDGDTLALGPLRIRRNGIDAPEVGQACKFGDGRNWDCANAAALRLERLVGESDMI